MNAEVIQALQKLGILIDLTNPLASILQPTFLYHDKKIQFPISLTSVYGEGGNALVVRVRDRDSRIYAARIGPMSQELFKLQRKLATFNMTPNVHYLADIPNTRLRITIMDKIFSTLSQYLKTGPTNLSALIGGIQNLIDKKTLLGMIHGDMHSSNIVILKDGETLGFIDFDYSSLDTNLLLTIVDFIPLLGSLRRYHTIVEQLQTYYKKTFQIDVDYRCVKVSKNGGYYYKELASYVNCKQIYIETIGQTFQEDAQSFVEKTLYAYFPSIELPKIVP